MCQKITTPKDANEAFAVTVKKVTPKKLSEILGTSKTHIYRMAADKKYNGETRNNVFVQALKALRATVQKGLFSAAFVVADSFAKEIGAELSWRDHTPDKDTYQEEIIDSLEAVSTLVSVCQDYIKGKTTFFQMRWAKKRAHEELDQLVAKAIEEKKQLLA